MWDDFLEYLLMDHDMQQEVAGCNQYPDCHSCALAIERVVAHRKFVLRQFKKEASKNAKV